MILLTIITEAETEAKALFAVVLIAVRADLMVLLLLFVLPQ